jgi:aspartate/methionine/tyrosine aminotransferase
MRINDLATELNQALQGTCALNLLSRKGIRIYFPSKGILGQSAEAREKAINATIGTAFEEDGSPLTLEVLENRLDLPSTSFLYAPSQGLPALRKCWKDMLLTKNPSLQGKSYSNPVVSAALTHALSVCGYLFVDEGDEIILPDLYWDNYDLVLGEAFGAKYRLYNTFAKGGYDVDAFAAALNEGPIGKKIVLLNFPNNPTGYTATVTETHALCEVIAKAAKAGNEIVVLLDDAYFGLVYGEGVYEESLFSLLVDLHENVLAVKLDGPTKEDYVWGFRVGFVTFGFKGATQAQLAALESKAAGVVRGSISNAPSISQALLLDAYQSDAYLKEKQEKFDILKNRYQKILEILANHPEYAESYTPMPFNSGYFMCVRINGVDPELVRKELLASYDTGVINLAGLLRLAFSAISYEKLEPLFANLHAAVQKLKAS